MWGRDSFQQPLHFPQYRGLDVDVPSPVPASSHLDENSQSAYDGCFDQSQLCRAARAMLQWAHVMLQGVQWRQMVSNMSYDSFLAAWYKKKMYHSHFSWLIYKILPI